MAFKLALRQSDSSVLSLALKVIKHNRLPQAPADVPLRTRPSLMLDSLIRRLGRGRRAFVPLSRRLRSRRRYKKVVMAVTLDYFRKTFSRPNFTRPNTSIGPLFPRLVSTAFLVEQILKASVLIFSSNKVRTVSAAR